jgi:WD40 repeat protein/serine/threonine protein kinase
MAPLLEQTEEYRVTPFPIIPGYEILEELGRGGMGVVYEARQHRPDRRVALKILLPELRGLPEKMARFRTEANAVARLHHPNIVQIFEVGEVHGLPFLSLELVEGGSLADKLGKPWLALEAVGLVEQLARALQYAHERGIVHRDLKPANILLGKSETRNPKSAKGPLKSASDLGFRNSDFVPKVTDFGLAKLMDEENGNNAWKTQVGVVLGTPPYMAPEQAAGRTQEIGPATDVHALGMILYEMLTGRPPFRAASMLETLEQVKTKTPTPPTQLLPKKDAKLDAICLRCLEKDPKRRFSSAAALAEDLSRYRSSFISASRRTHVKRPTVVALQTILAIISTLGSVLTVWQVFQAEHGKRAGETRLAPKDDQLVVDHSQLTSRYGERDTAVSTDRSPLTSHPSSISWLALNRGFRCLEEGNIAQGMLCLARSIQQASPEDRPLQHLARANLVAWQTQLNALHWAFHHGGPVEIVGIGADGKTAFTLCHVRSSPSDQHAELHLRDCETGKQIGEPILPKGPIACATLSPDGRAVIFAGPDGLAQLWDVKAGRPIGPPLHHEGAVTCVAFSPKEQKVLTTSADGAARLWDAQTGRLIGSPLQHLGEVTTGAFSPDGALIVTASLDGNVRIWDASTFQSKGFFMKHDGPVRALAFSPNGRILLTGSDDRSGRLWDTATGRMIGKPFVHADRVVAVAFSPDGMSLATGSADRTARLRETATGKPIGSAMQHSSAVKSVQFSSDGHLLLATCADFSAQLWDTGTTQPLGRPLSEPEKVTTAVLSPDGRRILTGSQEGTCKLWDIARGLLLNGALQHRARVSAAQFSPDGRTLLTASWDWTARLWDARTGQPIGQPLQHNSTVQAAAFSPDGRRVITGAGALDRSARIWDVRTGELACPPLLHPCGVVAVAFSPNGNFAVTVGTDHGVRLWNGNNGQPLRPPLLHQGEVQALAVSPDGKMILTGCSDGAARLWDAETGALKSEPIRHPASVQAVAFSPNGRQFVTGCQDGKARLWNAATAASVAELTHGDKVNIVAFSADGRWILTAGQTNGAFNDHRASGISHDPGAVRLWDASTARPHGTVLQYSHAITTAVFSPDSTMVFIGDNSGSGRLWDIATAKPIGPVLRHPTAVTVAAFAPDSLTLVTGDRDGVARLWTVPQPVAGDPSKIVSWVEQITGRKLDTLDTSSSQVAVSGAAN